MGLKNEAVIKVKIGQKDKKYNFPKKGLTKRREGDIIKKSRKAARETQGSESGKKREKKDKKVLDKAKKV